MKMLDIINKNRALILFEEMCAIPHGSGNTKQISDYLKEFAVRNCLEFIQDKDNNIVIHKNASIGKENVTRLIIQAHMDMVCEKEDDCDFDFDSSALDLAIDGDFIYAKGTTLGADDISGVALGLAVLEDDSLSHGPITCVFTVDEEIGMLGAISLDKKCVQGDAPYLLNIDNEKEGHFLTSCAGGVMAEGRLKLEYNEQSGNFYEIIVSGCVGGHSGETINRGSANAVKVLGELLNRISDMSEVGLHNINGGLKDNAIPRKATAVICTDINEIELFVNEFDKEIRIKYISTDPEISVTINKCDYDTNAVIKNSKNIISYINSVPDGVVDWSKNLPGTVETSLNLGVLKIEKSELFVCHLLRSSVTASQEKLANKVINSMIDCGIKGRLHSSYPAWEHKENSVFREIIKMTCEQISFECVFEGIHAGLECGVFYEANPKLDIVSFGPDIFDIHTPSEKMSISSFNRCYDFIKALIPNIS